MAEFRLLEPGLWSDYELIDCGDFRKLERFGAHMIIRPEPQALWPSSMPFEQWRNMAGAEFSKGDSTRVNSDEKGKWFLKKNMPEQWCVEYKYKAMSLRMRLGLTSFKHVGIFPEQAVNWNYIYDNLDKLRNSLDRQPKVLNLFAYTGGATLAACIAGSEVTHVDSVKQVVSWAKENMELSGLDGVRWIVDDALKFVKREVRRGNRYDAIILDPPAYGRGPDGEKWVLEQNIGELLSACSELLSRDKGFIILNLYSMGLSSMLARSAMREYFKDKIELAKTNEEFGELYFSDKAAKDLPLGVFYRANWGI